jgi:hypothetical protein
VSGFIPHGPKGEVEISSVMSTVMLIHSHAFLSVDKRAPSEVSVVHSAGLSRLYSQLTSRDADRGRAAERLAVDIDMISRAEMTSYKLPCTDSTAYKDGEGAPCPLTGEDPAFWDFLSLRRTFQKLVFHMEFWCDRRFKSRCTVPTFCYGICLLVIRHRGQHYGWALKSSAKFFAQ